MASKRGTWPALEWGEWKDTAETLHMYLQIVGKTQLELTPLQNHWWNITQHLTARGLTTTPMQTAEGDSLEIEFDFIAHELLFRMSNGAVRSMALVPKAVRVFYADYLLMLSELGLDVELDPMPVELANPIRFDKDDVHASYDRGPVERFWDLLRRSDFVFKKFSTEFYGKISPVHFFWGSMDLAVTRFSGRKAPPRAGADPVQAEAYSHEVISAGVWPGNGGYGQAAFYAYAAPVPAGLSDAVIPGPGAYNKQMGEFVLNYAEVAGASDPEAVLMKFLESTYAAAADAARWDRENLDRREPFTRRGRG